MAGGLALHLLRRSNPQLNVHLFESKNVLAGNHTWCFHRDDLNDKQFNHIKNLVSHSWNSYEVAFPNHNKKFKSEYLAIESECFAKLMINKYKNQISLNSPLSFDESSKKFLNGEEEINAKVVIDARGWNLKKISTQTAYQKFVGWEVEFNENVDRSSVFLMDAQVEQIDGYRFMYTLPFSSRRFLVEDTYYSNDGEIDFYSIEKRLHQYISDNYCKNYKIIRKEHGSLPLELGQPQESQSSESILNLIALGAQAGLAHPTTGYTVPILMQQLSFLGFDQSNLRIENLVLKNQNFIRESKNHQSFFRLLNRMLFMATSPENRVKIMDRFYTLPESLIKNFYKGQLSGLEKLKVLALRPPVPLLKAVQCLSERTQIHYG